MATERPLSLLGWHILPEITLWVLLISLLDHIFSPLELEVLSKSVSNIIDLLQKGGDKGIKYFTTFAFLLQVSKDFSERSSLCLPRCSLLGSLSPPVANWSTEAFFFQDLQGSKCQNARSYPVHALGLSTSESKEGVGRDLSD